MEICSNCLKEISQAYHFCPACGYPAAAVGFKRCARGHLIYETYNSCPFCGHRLVDGATLINPGATTKEESGPGKRTEILGLSANMEPPPDTKPQTEEIRKDLLDNKTVLESNADDRTVLETDADDRTVLESDPGDRTHLETMTGFPDKTIMEEEADKTILEGGITEEFPPFFAWLVYIDEQGRPLHDVRLTRPKSVIGKGAEADIRLKDDFASKLHAVIHFEEGKFFLSDLGSTNHTWLNEIKIMNEEIKDGDRVRIGHQNLVFKRVRRSL